jgi:hypothetical protein
LREGLSREKLVKNTTAMWTHGFCINRNWIYLRLEVMGTEALQQHGSVNNEDVETPPSPQKRGGERVNRNTRGSFREREAMP